MNEHFDYEKIDGSALDDLIEGFQFIDFDWRYLYVNQAVVKQSKYGTKEDLLGFTMMQKYPGIAHSPLFKVLQDCMSNRISKYLENEFEFPDGSKGWFELRIHPVSKGIFILSIDITERKKAEAAIKDHVSGLEEVIFLTSHRVRQPIANILGIANILDKSPCTQEELLQFTSHLKVSAQSLDALTQELSTFVHEMKVKANGSK